MPQPAAVTVAQLGDYDEIIDARSEAEYALDHIPGAINCPVLTDAERARVGTLYKQVSPFEAKKIGAALVSRNIARHLEERFADRPKNWRPLVYCWRGGKRSGSLALVLGLIGWHSGQLEGGYKAYRRQVVTDLAIWPAQFQYRVLCGPTGTAKSRVLQAIAAQGGQTLDLEALARHRGSVLGNLPDQPQPSQKRLDSQIWQALRDLDRSRPVYVEAESKKVGRLDVPDALLTAMWQSPCIRVETSIAARVEFLLQEYAHFLDQPTALAQQLECLANLHGHVKINDWKALIASGQWPDLVATLLTEHYDPAYLRSIHSHYPRYGDAQVLPTEQLTPADIQRLAGEILGTPI